MKNNYASNKDIVMTVDRLVDIFYISNWDNIMWVDAKNNVLNMKEAKIKLCNGEQIYLTESVDTKELGFQVPKGITVDTTLLSLYVKEKLDQKMRKEISPMVYDEIINEDYRRALINKSLDTILLSNYMLYYKNVEMLVKNRSAILFLQAAMLVLALPTVLLTRVCEIVAHLDNRNGNKSIVKVKERIMSIKDYINNYIIPALKGVNIPQEVEYCGALDIPIDNITEEEKIMLDLLNRMQVSLFIVDLSKRNLKLPGTLKDFADFRIMLVDNSDEMVPLIRVM